MTSIRFRDRKEAGQRLAALLSSYAKRDDVVVLALPRGGVPVAFEVARTLEAPLDVFLVRKLGAPGHPEFAIGAIATGGVQVLNHGAIADLHIPAALIEQVAVRERAELERRDKAYHVDRPQLALRGKTVIVVDDGLATGSTMEAAVIAVREHQPSKIVVASPVGAVESCQRLRAVADDVVCLQTPDPFNAVGLWYQIFDQTTDAEVVEHLRQANPRARSSSLSSSSSSPDHWPAKPSRTSSTDVGRVRRGAQPITDEFRTYDSLIKALGSARMVLLGGASHGTHEFYRERAFITERLISEAGFSAVAVEADWPDAYRVNRYVRGASDDAGAVEAMSDFRRCPPWTWRNTDVVAFVEWLRAHNDTQPIERRAAFYGIDLYSLRTSMGAVVEYLSKVDLDAAKVARTRYACFDHFGDESYGLATTSGWALSCEQQVVRQLVDLQRRRAEYASRDGRLARDDYFYAEQNARLVRNAEMYYRTMFRGRHESWNLRDRHMADTLEELLRFLEQPWAPAKIVVWAHNSHLGDARATEMGQHGELNVGQLARERHGTDVVSVGFTTYVGTVTAASDWDGPPERKTVRPALPNSYERLFHEIGRPRFLLPLRDDAALARALASPRLERAIGVVYKPETERGSHYLHARLALQFDYVLHFDETTALEPLERTAAWTAGEPAETYPSGL